MKPFLSLYTATAVQLHALQRKELRQYEHDLAWELLRIALKQQCTIDLTKLELKQTEHGKPYFAGLPLHFNLSHCSAQNRTFVCCALSPAPVGVDAAPIRPYEERLAQRICTQNELSLLQNSHEPGRALMELWTQKESYLKLTGVGLSGGLRVEVSSLPGVYEKTVSVGEEFLLTVCTENLPCLQQIKIHSLAL